MLGGGLRTSTATKHLGPVGQRPKRPVPGGQRRVVSRLGVLDLLFGILKFPLQVRPWPERIGNGCRFAALQRRVDPTTFYQGLSPRGRGIFLNRFGGTRKAYAWAGEPAAGILTWLLLIRSIPAWAGEPPCGSLALAIVNRSPASRAAKAEPNSAPPLARLIRLLPPVNLSSRPDRQSACHHGIPLPRNNPSLGRTPNKTTRISRTA